ncbi:MAG: aldo/keto reductase [archaeon]
MEFKKLSTGFNLPVLGFGTWAMGGLKVKDTTHDKEDINAIKTALKLGITHIDTAESYSQGHSEELVGEAINEFDRKTLFITTKVAPQNFHYDDLINSAKNSLKRLQVDYIDLYLLHSPNPEIPIEESMKAMDYLVEQGMVRNIGISNFSVDEMKKAQACTKNKIVTNQIDYSLLVRNKSKYVEKMESEIIPYCQENDILVTAYKPLALGRLGKENFPLLKELAERYNKTPAQIALNWVISKKNIVAIFKSTNPEHIKENLGALGWKLEPEDVVKLDQMGEK